MTEDNFSDEYIFFINALHDFRKTAEKTDQYVIECGNERGATVLSPKQWIEIVSYFQNWCEDHDYILVKRDRKNV